jgi:hypothetical protein
MKCLSAKLAVLAAGFFACVTLAGHTQDAKPTPTGDSLTGAVVSTDAATKTITVKSKEVEYAIKYTDTTKFETIKTGSSSDLTDGVEAKVQGKLAEDQSSIEASMIEVLKASTKIAPMVRASENFVVGKLTKDGDKWVVVVGEKKIAMTGGDSAKIRIRADGTVDDATAGASSWIVLKHGASEPTATRVQIQGQ